MEKHPVVTGYRTHSLTTVKRGAKMSWSTYTDLFRQATCGADNQAIDPFPYQKRLAEGPLPSLLHVPTGAGKTAAMALSWLWRRRFDPNLDVRSQTPRRLVYCLPMRILVEQTYAAIESYLHNLDLVGQGGVHLHQLMGGSIGDDWFLYPEEDAILVGTQDMLLSRALNRGYGLSRFRWPQPFGLLHSDALWVFDEIQLFGAGLPTTAQLEGFRRRFGFMGSCKSVWMSATLQPAWLETADHQAPAPDAVMRLGPDDLQHQSLQQRLHAAKQVTELSIAGKDARGVSAAVAKSHTAGTMTLVIMNTVERAVAVYGALGKLPGGGSGPELLLLHSRFRPCERRHKQEKLASPVPPAGRIVISTQVVEAGVDISAQALFTELAPWPSIVQRLGRCNRYGEYVQAKVYWIDVAEKEAAPYSADELAGARTILLNLEGQSVAPAHLPDPEIKAESWDVIRSTDLRDLFDTSPDLSGNDIDVSRFIREGNDHDLYLFWRDWNGAGPDAEEPGPHRDEICPAPIGGIREFLSKEGRRAWRWDHLTERWRVLGRDELRPGMTLMLHSASGGYSLETGWNPASLRVEPLDTVGLKEEGAGDDRNAVGARIWESVADHTEQVVAELDSILKGLNLPDLEDFEKTLLLAARWHDAGKAHEVFQKTMMAGVTDTDAKRLSGELWAKSPQGGRHSRRHFRHELASALALLQHEGERSDPKLNLAAYLIAAHHGRVRLTIRALPNEDLPSGERYPSGTRYALGIWEGDLLPSATLGGGVTLPPTMLSLATVEMGRGPDGNPSWLERTLDLRDSALLGPFRLAYLEALVRAADSRASARGREELMR